MNYNQDFEINKIEFNYNGLNSIQAHYFVTENWPIVYILNNIGVRQAYVGETIDTNNRISTHLQSPSKRKLKEVYLISSKKFNKSASLDIESNLIKYIHADGKYELLNGNLGIVNHSYYQREHFYWELFKNIWNSLISKGIAQHSLEYISNSDLFKYSPYKTLSIDQRKNLILIIDALLSTEKKYILIEGSAGTGKTILAIFLFKLMLTSDEDFNYKEFAEDEQEILNKVRQLKKVFPNPKMGLVIAMSSFRKTIKKVFNNIQGLNQSMVIGPSELANTSFDILFIDESHRLRKRVNLTNYASFDNTARALGLNPLTTNELEWTILKSKKALYFYDPKQSIKPSDVNAEDFIVLKNKRESKTIQLFSQFRAKGGNGYVQFVDNLLDSKIKDHNFKYFNLNYDVQLFASFKDFVSELRLRNEKYQLCRFVAGYGWKWISKNDRSKFDIEIEGLNFQWNHDNIEFILKDQNAEQIGCIHTSQGYDLNYVGVIFGPEIILNPNNNEIEIVRDNYHDTNGQNTITDIRVLKSYIINIYKTIMLRGILGCYIYVCDKNLRNYFKNHIHLHNSNTVGELRALESPDIIKIPFENSIPLYSLKIAAGEFYLNESLPDTEFILVPEGVKITRDHFACKIIGNSMNKIVPDGKIALFKKYKGGSRNGLMVIAEYYNFQDPDYGSCYTFKEYYSQKVITEEGWQHKSIVLRPKSFDSSYKDIVIDSEQLNEKKFNIIGIFEMVLD